MDKHTINKDIAIAIGLLEQTRTDYYGNGRVTHSRRNFVTATVTELLNKISVEIETETTDIITEKSLNINPPDEP